MNIVFGITPVLIVGLIVSTILPLLVGLVTKAVTNSSVKAILLAALSAITGLGTELLNAITANQPYDIGTGIVLAFTAFIVAVGIHYGIYKPTGATAAVQAVGNTSPNTVVLDK